MVETEPQLIEQYVRTGKAKLVYRHLIQLGDASQALAEASECAGTQGKFWEMRELIYREQDALYTGTLAALQPLADQLDLKQEEFAQCVEGRAFRQQVEADAAASERNGVTSRPVMDINGQRLIGALPFERYQTILDNRP